MKLMRYAGIPVVIALCALPARGDQQQLATDVMHALTPIDSIPTKEELTVIFPTNTVTQLASIAQDAGVDFGVRLRAIRALPQFCATSCAGTTPHSTLVALLGSISPSDSSGSTILLLRATIEALGIARSGDPNDVNRLVPFLDSNSRDIRAAAAFALRDLCDSDAITPLRNRYNVEMGPTGVPQVRLAISEALRDLGTCN